MRLARWLIPAVLMGLSGPNSPPEFDAPSPTLDAAAPIRVRDGTAHFRIPATGDGPLVIVVSALGNSRDTYPVSIRISENVESATFTPTSPLLPIQRYRRQPKSSKPSDPLIVPAAATVAIPGNRLRTFDVPLLNGRPIADGGSARVLARPIATGSRSVVYLDESTPPRPRLRQLASAIIHLLESTIMPSGDRLIGPPADVDHDGRLTVLLTSRLAHLQNGQTTVGGFVRAADFRPGFSRPLSNQADMIYLNTHLSVTGDLVDVLSHEYRHVLAFSHRDALGRETEEDWLNEALAHLAEPGDTNISHRVKAYLRHPAHFPLVVPDYYRSGLWRCDGVRGASFLFLEWCRQKHGEDLVGRMLSSANTGTDNLVSATRTPFPQLYRQWSVSLLYGHGTDSSSWSPSVCRWDGTSPLTVRVATTATAYVVPDKIPAGTVIRVDAPADSRLQVTAATMKSTGLPLRPNTSAVP